MKISDDRIRRNVVHLQFVEHFLRAFFHLALVEHGTPTQFPPQKNILRNRQMPAHIELLMDDRNAELLRFFRRKMYLDVFAEKLHAAFVARVNTGDDFDERRFSRAVFSEQRHHFAFAQFERHIVERMHAEKRFVDMPHIHNYFFIHHSPSFFKTISCFMKPFS